MALALGAAIPGSIATADPSGTSTAGLATAIRKPKLYRMLANNSRVDTNMDEIRMDFVLRVAHGEVDASAPTGDRGSQTGLRILYDYGHSGTSDGTPTRDYSTNNPVPYLNTRDTKYGKGSGATMWSTNRDQYYTILKVISSGPYDYLMISLECDVDIPDIYWNDGVNGYQVNWWSKAGPDGMTWQPSVYAMVGPWATKGYSSDITTAGKDWCTDVAAGSEATMTVLPGRGDFAPENARTDDNLRGYDAPMDFIGYDDHPRMWAGGNHDGTSTGSHWNYSGQSNWSMFTDEGFNIKNPNSNLTADAVHTPSGVAPANSFFIEWYNPILKEGPTYAHNPCYRVESFKFQWFGLQNESNWVPVTALTPDPVTVKNAPLATNANTDIWPKPMDDNGTIVSKTPQGYSDMNMAAFNSTSTVLDQTSDHTDHTSYNIMAPGDAQNPDGSIDFKKAMHEQLNPQLHPAANAPVSYQQGGDDYRGLDGYFKLVTWPVISSSCTADPASKYNPRNPLNPGASSHKDASNKYDGTFTTADVDSQSPTPSALSGLTKAATPVSQNDIGKEIESGWTAGTAWYKFDVVRPDPPAITGVKDSTDPSVPQSTFQPLADDDRDLDLGTTTQTEDDNRIVTQRGVKTTSFAQHPQISGTGTPGDTINLYYDEPKVTGDVHMDTGDPNNTDPDVMGNQIEATDPSTGAAVETTVDATGHWQITDPNPVDQADAHVGSRTRRYHAYQTEHTDDLELSSNFSPLAIVGFLQAPGEEPYIDVTVPHTVNGALRPTAKVTVTVGSNIPEGLTATLDLSASSVTDPSQSMALHSWSALTSSNTSESYSIPVWQTPPSGSDRGTTTAQFDQFKALGIDVHFTATLTTSANTPATGTLDYRCNMDAPVVTIAKIDHDGIRGSVTAAPGGNATTADEEGGKVSVTWVDADGTAHKAKKNATVAADGSWSAPLYAGIYSGTVEAQATDSDGNQSARPSISQAFQVTPPLTTLPMTGGASGLWPLVMAVTAVIALLAAGALNHASHRHRALHGRVRM